VQKNVDLIVHIQKRRNRMHLTLELCNDICDELLDVNFLQAIKWTFGVLKVTRT